MRPQSIVTFERFYLGALAVGLVNTALNWSMMQERLASDPNAQAVGMGSGFLVSALAIGFAIPLLLWYFIAKRRSNIAKWILVVLFAIGLLSTISTLASPMMPGGIQLVLALVALAMQAYAVYMLFRPDAVAWLNRDDRTGPTP